MLSSKNTTAALLQREAQLDFCVRVCAHGGTFVWKDLFGVQCKTNWVLGPSLRSHLRDHCPPTPRAAFPPLHCSAAMWNHLSLPLTHSSAATMPLGGGRRHNTTLNALGGGQSATRPWVTLWLPGRPLQLRKFTPSCHWEDIIHTKTFCWLCSGPFRVDLACKLWRKPYIAVSVPTKTSVGVPLAVPLLPLHLNRTESMHNDFTKKRRQDPQLFSLLPKTGKPWMVKAASFAVSKTD